jgi:hypothetical protein
MKRLDLIISAIEDALKDFKTDSYENEFHGCCGADPDVGHTTDCKLTQALAAARELRELKPVACLEIAATELRRLYEVNRELVEELTELLSWQSLAPEHVVLSAKMILAKSMGDEK